HFTICSDGTLRDECYVAVENYDAINPEFVGALRSALYRDRAIVRGSIIPHEFPMWGDLGELVVSEGWTVATDAGPDGFFWRLRGPELVCITYPCFDTREQLLNSRFQIRASTVDFSNVPGIDGRLITRARVAMQDGNLIATGVNVDIPDEGPAGDG